jgi:nicotinamidase-related amidase
MTVSALDPTTALVLIDLQFGIVAMPTAHNAAEIVNKGVELATAFRDHGLPVILVNVDAGAPGRTERGNPRPNPPANWATLVPELNVQPSDIHITKQQWGAFTNTELFDTLKNLGVTQIVLAGLMTTKGVESTARNAHELGFNVTLATDAMSDTNLAAHENSIANVFPHLGETGTSQEILSLLAARAS